MNIQEIRETRQKGVSIFAKFCQDRKYHNDFLFCFFEGEDIKYYNSRIKKHTYYSFEKIINYNCGGRSEVLKAYQLIKKKEEYSTVNVMFFVDRDYFPLEGPLKDVYQTPCYSIENFYTSEECFSQILNREFGINAVEDDFKKCVNDFRQRQNEFHQATLLLNAWLSCQRKVEKKNGHRNLRLSEYRISRLFSAIEIDALMIKECINIELLEKQFPDSYNIPTDFLRNEYDYFCRNDCQKLFRGKFELEFMKKIIDSIIEKNKEGTYFIVQRQCVKIDPNVNTLSTLSEYANTPEDLIEFLKSHRCKTA